MNDQQLQKDYKLSIDLKISEINIILVALDELPRKISNPIFESIKNQAEEQVELLQPKT